MIDIVSAICIYLCNWWEGMACGGLLILLVAFGAMDKSYAFCLVVQF